MKQEDWKRKIWRNFFPLLNKAFYLLIFCILAVLTASYKNVKEFFLLPY